MNAIFNDFRSGGIAWLKLAEGEAVRSEKTWHVHWGWTLVSGK